MSRSSEELTWPWGHHAWVPGPQLCPLSSISSITSQPPTFHREHLLPALRMLLKGLCRCQWAVSNVSSPPWGQTGIFSNRNQIHTFETHRYWARVSLRWPWQSLTRKCPDPAFEHLLEHLHSPLDGLRLCHPEGAGTKSQICKKNIRVQK